MKRFYVALLCGILFEVSRAACLDDEASAQNLTDVLADCPNAKHLVWTSGQGEERLTNEVLRACPQLESISLIFPAECDRSPLDFNNMTNLKAVCLTRMFPCVDYLTADYFGGATNLVEVRISENPMLMEVHPGLFYDQVNLLRVELTHNALAYLPRMLFKRTRKLQTLNLSHNKFKEVAFRTPTLTISQLPASVMHLDISYNSLNALTTQDLDWCRQRNQTLSLKLAGNPWQCDCAAKEFVLFVNAMLPVIKDSSALRCQNTSELYILGLNADDLCSNVALMVGISFSIVLLLVVLLAVYYRKALKVWLYAHGYCLWYVLDKDEGNDKCRDAFITCASLEEDILWELIRQLEDGPKPYKLCWYNRDFAVSFAQDDIIDLVRSSRRVIIVLSSKFLQTIWARKELRTVFRAAVEERKRFIVIRYKDTDHLQDFDRKLKAHLKLTTYLNWGEPNFWDKLRYALPHQR